MKMPSPELDRLVTTGVLAHEAPIREEFEGLVRQAAATLNDSKNLALATESRFQLAYGAAHSLSLAALRWHGYRPRNRQVVFQALAHTLGTPAAVWRTLAKSHELRNRHEYEGGAVSDERLLEDVIEAADGLLRTVRELGSPNG
ncbi:MAG: hypothetical protein LC732_02850 [Acidobacteria bacterium]|nr:hypothetical protein [Acidobacteriota bacterium]